MQKDSKDKSRNIHLQVEISRLTQGVAASKMSIACCLIHHPHKVCKTLQPLKDLHDKHVLVNEAIYLKERVIFDTTKFQALKAA